jgi:hypothetical protein
VKSGLPWLLLATLAIALSVTVDAVLLGISTRGIIGSVAKGVAFILTVFLVSWVLGLRHKTTE